MINCVVIGGEVGLFNQDKLSEYMDCIFDIVCVVIKDIGYEQDKFYWEMVEIINLLYEQFVYIV